jgi:hypothetical protein
MAPHPSPSSLPLIAYANPYCRYRCRDCDVSAISYQLFSAPRQSHEKEITVKITVKTIDLAMERRMVQTSRTKDR